MKLLIAVLLLILSVIGFIAPVQAQAKAKTLDSRLYDSVAILYYQNDSGDMKTDCTVTAFATTPKGYRFVSAAHCVVGDDDKQQKLQKFYISTDTNGEKAYIPAKLIQAGDKTQGDDFSLFEVETVNHFDTVPLGDDSTLGIGDRTVNVAGALGLGKQYFEGYVSELHIDRPPVDAGGVLWTDLMLVQIGGGPGSSGSAIVSITQNAIIGFLVGSEGSGDVGKLCVPVTKFKKFVAAVDAGTYKKQKVSDQAASAGGN